MKRLNFSKNDIQHGIVAVLLSGIFLGSFVWIIQDQTNFDWIQCVVGMEITLFSFIAVFTWMIWIIKQIVKKWK